LPRDQLLAATCPIWNLTSSSAGDGARHYDAALGQFIQRDPIGFAAGDLNLYAYVWNDPYNWSDPSGLATL
jgi:RHS repeat-associated protein